MDMTYTELPGSYREPPAAAPAFQPAATSEQIEVSVYLKDREPDPLAASPAVAQPRAAMAATRAAAYEPDIAKVVEFADQTGLSVVRRDPARRLVKLAGPLSKMEAAFRTKLHAYNDGRAAFRGRQGSLSVPQDLVDSVEAVLGLDTRPVAKPKLQPHFNPQAIGGHLPNEMARLYSFPTGVSGKGQCIALIELGGGYRNTDNKLAFAAMKLPTPQIVPISVSGGINRPGVDPGADSEVALDIQVAGGAAPGAAIAVYFAPNSAQGFVDAITRAVHDDQHKPTIISISWGGSEGTQLWSKQAIDAMTTALRDAARLNITVLAACGDNLATDGLHDGRVHVDFPASSPYVVGCGGTLIDTSGGQITSEKVWNQGSEGTGGGVSETFGPPPYQKNANVPKSISSGQAGRGVPDVAASADPSSGYKTVVGGHGTVIGGTSAVAPLWAGLFARINEKRGAPVGLPHATLYANPQAFRDITQGDNKLAGLGYASGAGWDACTGLGVPIGDKILAAFVPKTATLTS